jgi:hypothetical protein
MYLRTRRKQHKASTLHNLHAVNGKSDRLNNKAHN